MWGPFWILWVAGGTILKREKEYNQKLRELWGKTLVEL